MENLLSDARKYLVEFLQGKQHKIDTRHPWRKEWEFAVFHALRVETYVSKILNREQHDLSEIEISLLRLAAVLHDVARLEETDDHARLGAEIAAQWLAENNINKLDEKQIASVVELIAGHSDKEVIEKDYRLGVLKDADTLDEIGIMSVFMASNWVDKKSPFFFHQLRNRLIGFEIPFCDDKFSILNTDGAREILREKKAFIENFIIQLEDELESDNQIEQLFTPNEFGA